jgi:hypothetical protein
VVPISFDLDGEEIAFTTAAAAIRRHGRVALCVDDDETPPFAFVRIDWHAAVDERPASCGTGPRASAAAT